LGWDVHFVGLNYNISNEEGRRPRNLSGFGARGEKRETFKNCPRPLVSGGLKRKKT